MKIIKIIIVIWSIVLIAALLSGIALLPIALLIKLLN
jgi:hypothetical protein